MRLAAFIRAIERSGNAQALKSQIMDWTGAALGADQTGLYLLQPETGRPAEIHVRQLRESFVVAYEELGRDEDKVLANALRTRRATCEEQVYGGESWRRSLLYRSFAARYQIRRYLCAPIVSNGVVVGTLNLGRRDEQARFDRRALQQATLVGRAIGARLARFSSCVDEPVSASHEITCEESARRRADRALLRSRLTQLEREATPLGAEEAARLLEELELQRIVPLDSFDRGQRRYLLLHCDADLQPAIIGGRLTSRELEVLRGLATGETNKSIAFDLGVTPSTISTHLSSVMHKLGIRSRVLLVAAARRMHLPPVF